MLFFLGTVPYTLPSLFLLFLLSLYAHFLFLPNVHTFRSSSSQ
ncbi:hypothetical protein MtrunA17_Chr8g0387691 [Medicago truncatula]|uniref:Transmembrane protein n=1 Tax=Medicago truncatula TaxID=3880 RepID=A0A396GXR2_MEDTR|nr:hypothetical protein MtrunA17_Chr8g0387691 [Medicago truncatula]